jgi:hypothetical protein
MKPYLAHSLSNLRAEVDARWPKRDKSSDGWVGDTSHQTRPSDHNPAKSGVVRALDITAKGINPLVVVSAAKKHPSTAYVIYNGVIWSRTYSFKAREYLGTNQHKTHIHVSILHTIPAEKNNRRWLVAGVWSAPKYGGKKDFVVGAKGPQVKVVQIALGRPATGTMNAGDVRAVKRYQRLHPKLWPADGVVGPLTYASLASSARVKRHFA